MNILSWDNATNRARAELLFENRNKEYGAYQIRRNYEKLIAGVFLKTVCAIALPFVIMFIVDHLSGIKVNTKLLTDDPPIILTDPPVIDRPQPMPPVIIPPPPVIQTIKFTTLKVVKPEEAPDLPPTPEEMKGVVISTETHQGEKTVELPPEIPVVVEDEKPRIWVEEMPEFPGGEQKLIEYLANNFKYPSAARENGIKGMVYIYFVVGKDGKVKDAKIVRGIGGGCDEEALRVVNSLPQWKPGRQNGVYVPVQFNVPLRLNLK
jgi:protein TonB